MAERIIETLLCPIKRIPLEVYPTLYTVAIGHGAEVDIQGDHLELKTTKGGVDQIVADLKNLGINLSPLILHVSRN